MKVEATSALDPTNPYAASKAIESQLDFIDLLFKIN